MLYDPKWEQKTKADPLSRASLIAWLEKQPADETYDFLNISACLLGQYFTAMGFTEVNVDPLCFLHGKERNCQRLPEHFNDISHGRGKPRTFGAALERARMYGKRMLTMDKEIVWLFVAEAGWVSAFWCIAVIAVLVHAHYWRK